MGDWDIHDPTKECADLFRGPDGFYMPHKGKFKMFLRINFRENQVSLLKCLINLYISFFRQMYWAPM